MSSWNEETKTLATGDGRSVCVTGSRLVVRHPYSSPTHLIGVAPADLAAFGHACLEAAGEPVETTPAPFKADAAFDDVQVEDRVRVTYKGEDPTEFTVTTVRSDGFWGLHTGVMFKPSKHLYTIDILSRPEPVFPRTVEASEAHEHVGSRVTVEKGGNTYTGRLSFASEGTPDSWLLSVEVQDAPHRLESHSLWLPASHPIILEAPADAGASVVGGA